MHEVAHETWGGFDGDKEDMGKFNMGLSVPAVEKNWIWQNALKWHIYLG